MATIDELVVRIKADASQLEKELKRASSVVGSNTKAMESQFAGLGKAIKGMGIEVGGLSSVLAPVIGAVGVRQVIGYSDAWKGLTNRLKLVTDSSSELASMQERLFQISQETRASLDATVTLYQRLIFSTRGLGISQSEVLIFTEQLNKQLAVGGLSATEAATSIFQLTQAFNKGKLDGDEFRTILESAPPILEALQKSLGKTRGEILAMSADGLLGPRQLIDAVNDMSNITDERFKNLEVTVGQAFQQLENAFIKFVGQSEDVNGASSAIVDGLQLLAENIDLVGRAALALAAVIGTRLAIGFGAALAAMNPLAAGLTVLVGGLAMLATASSEAQEKQQEHNQFISNASKLASDLEKANYDLANSTGKLTEKTKESADAKRKEAEAGLVNMQIKIKEAELDLKLLQQRERLLPTAGSLLDDNVQKQIDGLKQLGEMYQEQERLWNALLGGTGDNGKKGSAPVIGGDKEAKRKLDQVQDLIRSLEKESRALDLQVKLFGEKEGAQVRAKRALELEVALRNKDLQLTKEQNEEVQRYLDNIEKQTEAYDALEKKQKEIEDAEKRRQEALEDYAFAFESAFEDAIISGEKLSDVLEGLAEDIARIALRVSITQPLGTAIGNVFKGNDGLFGDLFGDLFGSSAPDPDFVGPQQPGFFDSIFSGLGFAEGGRPPVGEISRVGEKGVEYFVPDQPGTIVPASKMGGMSVIVQQSFHMSPGLQGTVEAEIRRAAPFIASQAQEMVFQAIERGGPEARSVGRRS